MILSKNIADKIVSELSKIVEQHINIMDIEGVIIASTDSNRIGSMHGGALKIINERLSELMIQNDDEFVGAKNGINLPIEFNEEIIGVIGMTGNYNQVYKYGQIIKKMTEILLLDSYMREQHMIEQKARDRFLEEWIFGRYESNYPNEFQQRAQRLGVDVKSAKRILVFSVRTLDDQQIDDQTQTLISHKIRLYLMSLKQAFLFRTATLFISVLNHRDDDEILSIAQEIENIIHKNCDCKAFIGIDSYEIKDVAQSFKNANAALQLSFKTTKQINIYDALNLDLFITRMPLKERKDYLSHLFINLTAEEIEPYIELLKIFYKENGSIEKTSEILFIHKNTLQYRLNKIAQITSYDPRKLGTAHLFMAAIMVYDSLKNDIL